jgi:hypothetical protein
MAPRSLLRHIFRHGPYSKARTAPPASKATSETPEDSPTMLRRSASQRQLITPDSAPESPLTYKVCSESRQSSFLEDIAEESEDTEIEDTSEYITEESEYVTEESDSDIDKTSIADTLAALQLSLENFSTRNLINAALNEAKIATYAHLDTLDTTLALLEALNGFSSTITVLGEEMVEKKRACAEKLTMLDAVTRVVERMQFEAEDSGEETE